MACLLNEAPFYFRAMRLGRAQGKATDFRLEFKHEEFQATPWGDIARYFRARAKDADADCRDNGLPVAKYELHPSDRRKTIRDRIRPHDLVHEFIANIPNGKRSKAEIGKALMQKYVQEQIAELRDVENPNGTLDKQSGFNGYNAELLTQVAKFNRL